MAEHIKVEIDLKPVEEGLPEDMAVYWIRRKERGCLRQAAYVDNHPAHAKGWYLFPNGTLPLLDVTHYGRPPQMGPTPCEESQESIFASERHN